MSVNDVYGMLWTWDIAALILLRVILMKKKLKGALNVELVGEKKSF